MNLLKNIDLDNIIIFKSVVDQYDNIILGVVGALAWGVAKAIMSSRNHKQIGEKLKAQISVRECMRKVTSGTLIDRFLFLEIKNGADKVVDGVRKRYRVSVIDECHKDGMKSISENYQNIFVDNAYQQMIQDGWHYNHVDYVVSEMEECDLKRIYQEEGVKYSRVYTVFINKETKKSFFLSVACYDNNFFIDEHTNKILKREIDNITNHYEFIYS